MRSIVILAVTAFYCSAAFSQKVVADEIGHLHAVGQVFQKAEVFHFQTQDIQNRAVKLEGLKKGTIISLDPDAIESLFQSQNEFISIPVPVTSRSQMVLTLKRHEIFTPDFKLFTSEDRIHPLDYPAGHHYKGIVEGDPNSLVAISIFEDQVMALIATDEGNFVIGAIEGDKDHLHILYNDKDLEQPFDFTCGTQDEETGYTQEQLNIQIKSRDLNDCVRIYIEVNDDIVTAKGGAVPAANYMTAIFNQCIVIYANEQINMILSEMLVWTSPSPYQGDNSSQMLSSYKANTEYFNGDLSHLISFDSLYGGVTTTLNGICNGSPDASKCFSGIRNNYDIVPIFSWPVFVISHEMGHLMGSNHTHACVWNGNNTAIDGCGPTSCAPVPPLPPEGGTIMSYCYPSNGSFINFNLGFGPQPGNVIRNSVNAASNCLTPCGAPVA
ncbi:MAG TPA: M12 family metallo-peptidase, partial [Saprospiraceae bacterium]|nr:M12 family metallo-peptidase [Saprospiraceae bacterium]